MPEDLAKLMNSRAAARNTMLHRWVRYHVIGFVAVIVVSIGLVIVDSRIAEIVGEQAIAGFRAILFLSILVAGLGARALLAWRSATVDLQGRIFLAVAGLLLLTAAAFGMSNCIHEIKEHHGQPAEASRRSVFERLD